MPELPEVETIRSGLARVLPLKTISDLSVMAPKLFTGDPGAVIGAKVEQIRRRGKVLLLDLSNGNSLLIHLKMTGQLVYQSKDETEKIVGGHPQAVYNQPLPHAHTYIIFTFDDGSKLFFNDLRKFGWVHVVPTLEADSYGMLKTLGPEPLEPGFTQEVLRSQLLRYPNRRIFDSLLDQTLIAGIGNIYANEALYEARIHPERKVSAILNEEWPLLWKSILHVLQQSIKYGGTSDSTYVNVEGQRGDYLNHAHVYHKKIAVPCGHEVTRKKIGGRTAHFCAVDQKL
jgi:formamidopyrimidine-DNA glycosylase